LPDFFLAPYLFLKYDFSGEIAIRFQIKKFAIDPDRMFKCDRDRDRETSNRFE